MKLNKILISTFAFGISATAVCAEFSLFKVSNVPAFTPLENSENIENEKSRFQQLNEFFEAGTLPTIDETLGIWSGRCYTFKSKNNAEGAVLIAKNFEVKEGNGNEGPLFPVVTLQVYKAIFGGHVGAIANRYDELSENDAKEFDLLISGETVKNLPKSEFAGNSIVTVNAPGNLQFEVRKNGRYFFGQSRVIRDQDNLKANDLFHSCYYFKKVKDLQ